MVDSLPRSFGKYILERRLGVGGMAETFVARREGDGGIEQHVCLKRVLPAFNGDPSFRDQFQREARLAARLRHSNIVGTIDYGSVGEVQYMALELVDGLDFRALLSAQPGRRLAESMVVLVAFDIAHALEYAHEPRQADEGIVHRDVTPANVLLSVRGEIKLADFGVAKALGTATVMTATGIMKGKMPYMPPEQMKGGAIDGRVDLFSLGVLMFEALAGRRPFVGAHDVEVMSKIISGDRPTLLELAPDVTPGLAAVVESLLSIEMDERVASATALIDLLTPFVPPPTVRETFASLVRAAYGEERHEGAASDTALARAGELPIGGSTPTADAYASTAIADSTSPSGRRVLAPTLREIKADSPRIVELPTPEPATRLGHGNGAPTGSEDVDTLKDSPNVPGGALSAPLDSARDTERDMDGPTLAEAVPTQAHRGEANAGRRSMGMIAVFAVGMLVAGGAYFSLGSSTLSEPASVAVTTPETVGESTPSAPERQEQREALGTMEEEPIDEPVIARAEIPPVDPAGALHDRVLPEQPGSLAAVAGGGGTTTAPGMSAMTAMTVPETETETVAEAARAATTMTPPATQMEARRARVPVRVTISPWGEVWIDGNYLGRAPVEAALRPGRHRISAGQDAPVMHRNVTVASGRRRPIRVHFDLEAVLSME